MKSLFSTFALLLFLGAGCVAEPVVTPEAPEPPSEDFNLDGIPEQPYETTSHNSTIWSNGTDEALVGTWQLESLTVNNKLMSFRGHTLTFNWDGSFSTDYASEEYTGPTSASGSCEFSGGTSGTMRSDADLDLDVLDANGQPTVFNVLKVTRAHGGPEVACSFQGGATIAQQISNLSLGTGKADSDAQGFFTPYLYTMDASWNTLTVTLTEPTVAVYVYTRVE